MTLPSETCDKCKLTYWACRCGSSPLSWKKDEPPTKCKNIYCVSTEFRWVESSVCCQRHYHHLGSTCKHCGQKD